MERKIWKTPAPLFEDPVYGAPTDPAVIWNEQEKCWWMFYTQRRMQGKYTGISSVHGSAIGIASSEDGMHWEYRGTAEGLAVEFGHNTYWAPEIVRAEGRYHMFVSYLRGIRDGWYGPAQILHFTSENLYHWEFQDQLELGADRVIDACLYEIRPGTWKLWYKDETHGSYIFSAVSEDLCHWELKGREISDVKQEGPNVFELGGRIWMICDCWDGLSVYSSKDYMHWKRQKENILQAPGIRPLDGTIGNHADVVVVSEETAYIFYFTHPYFSLGNRRNSDYVMQEDDWHTVIQTAPLSVRDGKLCCDRNEDFAMEM